MLKPINGNILLELPERQETTESGIVLPEKEEIGSHGIVKAVADKKKHGYLIGKTVQYEPWAGYQLEGNYLMLYHDRILGVWN